MDLILIGRIGDQAYALPGGAIERILPMAALTPLPAAPSGVAGVLNYHGEVLAVVDPRARLGLPTAKPHPTHHLLVVTATTRYLLWIDEVKQVRSMVGASFVNVTGTMDGLLAPSLVRLGNLTIPLLSLEALDPGPLLTAAPQGAQ